METLAHLIRSRRTHKAFGRFWGFWSGWLSWSYSLLDMAVYPALLLPGLRRPGALL